MKIATDILLSLLLIGGGYVFVCHYLRKEKAKLRQWHVLELSTKRICYLLSAVCVAAVLVILFEMIYELHWISQWKLLRLVLLLFPIAVIDFRLQKIPNQLLLFMVAVRCLIYIIEYCVLGRAAFVILKDNVIGALAVGIFFLLLLLIFKNSIGMGDIKLFVAMGLYQGLWGVINSVFFSLAVSFVISVTLLITRKKGRKDTISFGPSILVGTVIAIALAGM